MALKAGKGHTLIELIIYFALSVAALGILASLITVARRTGDHTYAQYLVAGNMATTIRMIRKELQATSLASVTPYGSKAGEAPGFSCVSAYDDKGEFQLGVYGTPHWQKHVYYTVSPEGVLTRWTTDIADKNYLPTLAPAPGAPSASTGKALMHDALPPNKGFGDWVKAGSTAAKYGGLQVSFITQELAGDVLMETVSPENPRDNDTEANRNSRLVHVVLRTLEETNFFEVQFMVAPRY